MSTWKVMNYLWKILLVIYINIFMSVICIYTYIYILKWYCIDGLLSFWRSLNSIILELDIHKDLLTLCSLGLKGWTDWCVFCTEGAPNHQEKMTILDNQSHKTNSFQKYISILKKNIMLKWFMSTFIVAPMVVRRKKGYQTCIPWFLEASSTLMT